MTDIGSKWPMSSVLIKERFPQRWNHSVSEQQGKVPRDIGLTYAMHGRP